MSKRIFIGRAMLGLLGCWSLGVAGTAMAQNQDCTQSLTGNQCFHLKGSDTLFDIITTGINTARSQGIQGANNLAYDGSGSGNAETAGRHRLPSAVHPFRSAFSPSVRCREIFGPSISTAFLLAMCRPMGSVPERLAMPAGLPLVTTCSASMLRFSLRLPQDQDQAART